METERKVQHRRQSSTYTQCILALKISVLKRQGPEESIEAVSVDFGCPATGHTEHLPSAPMF